MGALYEGVLEGVHGLSPVLLTLRQFFFMEGGGWGQEFSDRLFSRMHSDPCTSTPPHQVSVGEDMPDGGFKLEVPVRNGGSSDTII